jgi:hypothetical protein
LWNAEVLDSETGMEISNEVARVWAENYKTENPSKLWSFFFGKDVFDTILTNDHFNYLEFVAAENDIQVEQLILYAWYTPAPESGRSGSEKVEAYDASLGCPSACPN